MTDFVNDMFRSPRPQAELAALVDGSLRMSLARSLSLLPRDLPRTHWRGIARAFPGPLLYVVTPRYAEQARALLRHRKAPTRIEVFENAGHALFVDEPARFNALIAEFAAAQ